jgi:DNA-binding NarL/FixJ family response regulator
MLSPREREVHSHLFTELSLKEIAGIMNTSENNVKLVAFRVYHKMNASSRIELLVNEINRLKTLIPEKRYAKVS